MIADKLSEIGKYGLPKAYCEQITAFVERCQREKLPAGRYDLLGEDLFVMVQRYGTRPIAGSRLEAHRVYSDVQYIISGQERILWAPADVAQVPEEDQTPASDTLLYSEADSQAKCAGYALLSAGMFALYRPMEQHMPCVHPRDDAPAQVEKLVFKARL